MVPAPMEILFVTSEVTPYSKVGGLGDVCGALPKALRTLGHRVTVISPLYSTIDPASRSLARRLLKVEVPLGGKTYTAEVYDGRTASGVDLVFLGNDELFRKVPYIYGNADTYELDAIRFGFFSRAALGWMKARDTKFDVVHAHDWTAALMVVDIKRDADLAKTPCVFTIHNLAHQGNFPKAMMETLGLPWDLFKADGLEFYEQMNLLKGAIANADAITTVSPTYAREIRTKDGGHGLDGVLRQYESKLHGILNGVDAALWNSATDTEIPSRFDPINITGKARCKTELQRELGLPMRPEVPVIGTVGRVVSQKGYDLLAKAAPQLLKNDVQLVLLGDGDAEILETFAELSHRWPDRVQVRNGFNESLAHRIIAGSDLFLVPSRFEPCGLTQMYAHRYGTLPIVRRTGGLADTVVDCDAHLETGTGFVFDDATPQALLGAVQRGLSAYAAGPVFDGLRKRVMRIDHSWERSARLYDGIYKELVPTA